MNKNGIFKLPETGGFFKLPERKVCMHPSHNPPSHMVIPHGHGYLHKCPGCGAESVIENLITFSVP